ncbi:FAS1 domain-containing protein [Aspergillus sp. HF37]|nr:FAS1 domain-containing protein [Aspergillus sp. HF37]
MRALDSAHAFLLLLTLSVTVSTAWNLPSAAAAALRKHLAPPNQHPMMESYPPNTVLPASTSPTEDVDPKSGHKTGPIVSDVLPKIKGTNIFASLTRDFESIATRLNDSSRNVTVLAPRNSAIQGLPRKPWESPKDYEEFGEVGAYQGSEGEDRARRNLRRFVEAHLIPRSPWRKSEEVETLGGGKLRWEKDGEKIYIHPGGIEVDHIASQVSNGEVWVLNGVVNYQ